MASIDLARRQMMLRRPRPARATTLDRARRTADRLAAIPGLTVLRPDHLAGAGTGLHQLDETKLLIGTVGPGGRRARRRRPAQPRSRRPARAERHRTRPVHQHDRQHRRRHGPSGRRFRRGRPSTPGRGRRAQRPGWSPTCWPCARRRCSPRGRRSSPPTESVLAVGGRRADRGRGHHAVPARHPAGDAGGAARRRRPRTADGVARRRESDQRVGPDDGVGEGRPLRPPRAVANLRESPACRATLRLLAGRGDGEAGD